MTSTYLILQLSAILHMNEFMSRWREGVTAMPTLDANSTTEDVLRGVDLSGKRVLVTGASGGIGRETARALAAAGATVVLAARSVEKTNAAMQSIHEDVPTAALESLELDLASLASVRRFAASFLSTHD